MKLAEVITKIDTTNAWARLLVPFDSSQARDDAAYDFATWQIRHGGSERGSFRNITRDEARRSWDLRRLPVARYHEPIRLYDYASGDPSAERVIWGIETTQARAERETAEAEAAMRRLASSCLEELLPKV